MYNNELAHYGVKGMRWGHRKRYYDSNGSLNSRGVKRYAKKGYAQDAYNANKSKLGKVYDKYTGAHKIQADLRYADSSKKANKARAEKYLEDRNSPEAKAARQEKIKKAAKVGAVAAGTVLAAYGTYKLATVVQNKRHSNAMKKAQNYIDKNFLEKREKTVFKDGTRSFKFETSDGSKFVSVAGGKDAGKEVGKYNAKVVATGRQMYKDATNTRFDKGIAKVVNAGDSVTNYIKRKKKR